MIRVWVSRVWILIYKRKLKNAHINENVIGWKIESSNSSDKSEIDINMFIRRWFFYQKQMV